MRGSTLSALSFLFPSLYPRSLSSYVFRFDSLHSPTFRFSFFPFLLFQLLTSPPFLLRTLFDRPYLVVPTLLQTLCPTPFSLAVTTSNPSSQLTHRHTRHPLCSKNDHDRPTVLKIGSYEIQCVVKAPKNGGCLPGEMSVKGLEARKRRGKQVYGRQEGEREGARQGKGKGTRTVDMRVFAPVTGVSRSWCWKGADRKRRRTSLCRRDPGADTGG